MYNSQQKGFTLIGLILVFAILGIVTLSVLKVVPVYMEHFAVSKSMEALENDPKIDRLTVGQVRTLLMKKFDVNAVTSVNGKHIKIRRGVGDLTVNVSYEVRDDYFSNIDLVLTFSDEFTVDVK